MTKMIKISNRLTTIASMVSPDVALADIGCDHGFLSIYLAENDVVATALACDINEGPLSGADTHIRQAGQTKKIKTRLSNGFEKINPGEVNSAVISGMGGELIAKIMTDGKAVVDELDEIIISPQSEISKARIALRSLGLHIHQEKCVLDEGKYYQVIKATHEPSSAYEMAIVAGIPEDLCLEYGPEMLLGRDEVMMDFLSKKIDKLAQIRDSLLANESTCKSVRIREIITEINTLSVIVGI